MFARSPRLIALAVAALMIVAACASTPPDVDTAGALEAALPETTIPQTATPAAATPTAQRATAEPTTVASPATEEPATTSAPTICGSPAPRSRVDVRPTGNRWSPLSLDLTSTAPSVVALPGSADWVLATDDGWHVTLADGSALTITGTTISDATADPNGSGDPNDDTPTTDPDGNVATFAEDRAAFANPIPDARVVYGGTADRLDRAVSLAEPTQRYRHDVLGDDIEAAAIEVIDACTRKSLHTITLNEPDVVEGLSPMLGDIDGDGVHEILATVSNGDTGARLVAWDLDGTLLAESPPIGRGNRWRNQMAIAPVGPTGEIEVIDVRTPHIGGTVEYFRFIDGELVRVAASAPNYTSHQIGSRNLDLAVVFDATADGQLNVVVPTKDREQLAILARLDGDVIEVARVDFVGRIRSNLAVAEWRSEVAFVADNDLFIFGTG